ncbi:hypothetical protein [Ideonella sp. BN130291]|uniref:hypothetical protein n=1 Tax=Ideonella sp. BN130291 TaxID=3112940 RepID=UPI002E25F34C|nr:hypothetical protein [Ideonella sp. BN130291]
MDPSIRLAAERVTAWHLARFKAHIEPPEPTMPPAPAPAPDVLPPVTDPVAPGQMAPMREPATPSPASRQH